MTLSTSLISNVSLLTLAQVIRVTSQALFVVLLGRYWSMAEFGHFLFAFISAKIVTQIAELGFSTTVLRDVSRDRGQLREILSAAIGLRCLSGLVVVGILGVIALYLPVVQEVRVGLYFHIFRKISPRLRMSSWRFDSTIWRKSVDISDGSLGKT